MLQPDEYLGSNHRGLRFTVGHHYVYPLALGSGHGTVRGGIRRKDAHPFFYEHLRSRYGRSVSLTKWHHEDKTAFSDPGSEVQTHDTVTFFLGPAHRHFGHFAVESLARAWMIPLANSLFGKDRIQYLILPEIADAKERGRFSFADLLPWQAQIYNILGIRDDNTILLTEPAQFSKLIVPEQAVLYGASFHASAAEIVVSRAPEVELDHLWPDADTKIFLTRGRRYLRSGYVAGTRYLEQFFARNGYRVVDNEALSALEQATWARKATLVMAIQSSSMHVFNILGNRTARLAYLKPLHESLDRNMAGALNGLVDMSQSIGFDEAIAPPDARQDRERLCVFRNVGALVSFFGTFDATLDLTLFDEAEFLRCVDGDISEAMDPAKLPAADTTLPATVSHQSKIANLLRSATRRWPQLRGGHVNSENNDEFSAAYQTQFPK